MYNLSILLTYTVIKGYKIPLPNESHSSRPSTSLIMPSSAEKSRERVKRWKKENLEKYKEQKKTIQEKTRKCLLRAGKNLAKGKPRSAQGSETTEETAQMKASNTPAWFVIGWLLVHWWNGDNCGPVDGKCGPSSAFKGHKLWLRWGNSLRAATARCNSNFDLSLLDM